MKAGKNLATVCAALCAWLGSAAQISGRVVSTDGSPLPGAAAVLTRDSLRVAAAAAGSDGTFALKAPDGKYLLQIKYLGRKTVLLDIAAKGSVALGDIMLSEEAVGVDSVVVTASGPVIRSEGGKTVMTVGGSYLSRMPDIGSVINQLPGVSAAGESVNVLGRGTPLILIDGRQVTSPVEYQSLRPDRIASVTLDRMPSAAYEAEYRAVIDIKTKQRLSGLHLNNDLYAGRRLSDEAYIQATQKLRTTTMWVGFNPRWRKNRNLYSETETLHLPERAFSNTYDDSLTDRRHSYRINVGIIQELGAKQTLKAGYGYYRTDNVLRYNTAGEYGSPEGDAASPFSATRDNKYTEQEHQASLRYDAKPGEYMSIGITADYVGKRTTDKSLTEETIGAEPDTEPQLTERRFRGRYNVATGLAELKAATRSGYELLAGAKYAYISNKSHSATTGAQTDRSRDVMRESNWAVYAQAGKTYGIATVEAAVRGAWYRKSYRQNENTLVDRHDFKLLPSLRLYMDFSPAFSLSVAGNIKLQQPGFQELNPMVYYTTSRSYYQGNPGLRPTLLRGVQLEAVILGMFSLSAELTDYKNLITDIYEPDPADRQVLRNTVENLPRARDWAVSLSCYKSFRTWGFSVYGRMGIPDTKVPFTEGDLHYTKPFYMAQASCWVQPREFVTVYASFSYSGKSRDKTTITGEAYDLSAGVQFSFAKNRMSVTVYADDILKRAWPHCSISYGSVRYTEVPDVDSRKIGISIGFVLERQRVNRNWGKSNEEEIERL